MKKTMNNKFLKKHLKRPMFFLGLVFSIALSSQNIYEGTPFDWEIGESWDFKVELFHRNTYLGPKTSSISPPRANYGLKIKVLSQDTIAGVPCYTLVFIPSEDANRDSVQFPDVDYEHKTSKFQYFLRINALTGNTEDIQIKHSEKGYLDEGTAIMECFPYFYFLVTDSLSFNVIYPCKGYEVYCEFPINIIPSFEGQQTALYGLVIDSISRKRKLLKVEDVLDAYLIYEKQEYEDEIEVSFKYNYGGSRSEITNRQHVLQRWDKNAHWWKEYLVYCNDVLEMKVTRLEE